VTVESVSDFQFFLCEEEEEAGGDMRKENTENGNMKGLRGVTGVALG
jgi:hypothetical protein